MAEVETPPAETRASLAEVSVRPRTNRDRADNATEAPSLSPADGALNLQESPWLALRTRLSARVPARWRAAWGRLLRWTHTPLALSLGTSALVVLGATAASSLLLIGVYGRGTFTPSHLVTLGSSDAASLPYGPQPPGGSIFEPPMVPPSGSSQGASNELSAMVLQQDDLPAGLQLLEGGSTGADAGDDLLGSYHAVYQRFGATASATDLSPEIAVFSLVGEYDSEDSAARQITALDASQLGAEAGLPQLSAVEATAPQIGDQSRAVYLFGQSGGITVGVYVIAVRKGALEAIVGVAWPSGDESLDEAVRLAQRASDRLGAIPPAPPPSAAPLQPGA